MIQISVTTDLKALTAGLDRLQREQIPFATSLAINRTAKDLQPALGAEAKAVFDRPRPFTTGAGATYLKPATKRVLQAEVGYKDIQSRYLRWEIAGGRRVQKGFEKSLSSLGLLPAGHLTTPGAGIKLDAFGNIPRAQLVQILGQLKSGASVFAGRGKRIARQGLFVVLPVAADPRVRHLTPGIWRRIENPDGTGRALVPLIHYIAEADYHVRLDLQAVAQRVVSERFSNNFQAAMSQAMSTAK